MKKTYNINLGGFAFIIDENAFEVLFNYLEALKRKFSNEAERKEILNDIEARMAELLLQKMGGRKEVVGIEDIEFLIAQMGRPEDIAGDEPAVESTKQQTTYTATAEATTTGTERIQKRLYRDPDDAQIGGVIAGLCHYFGIHDPTWARIAAIILLVASFGTTTLVYLLLLIIIPEAKTAAEKLQMKGEPVNVNTIEKEVKDAANRFSVTMKASVTSEGFFKKLWAFLSQVAKLFIRFAALLVVIGAFFVLIGLVIGFGMFALMGPTPFHPLTSMVVENPSILTIGAVGILLFVGAPVIVAIYAGLKVLIGGGRRLPWLKWVLLFSCMLGFALLMFSVYKVSREFISDATVKEEVQLAQPANGTLFVQLADSTDSGWVPLDPDADDDSDEEDLANIFVNGQSLDDITSFKIGRPTLELIVSENDSFYLQKLVSSQGRNRTNARDNAKLVMYSFLQADSVVNLKKHIEVAKNGGKFRGQDMIIRLAIPEGKKVRFGNNIDEWPAIVKGDSYYDYTLFANTTWTVEGGRVRCLDCTRTTRDNDDEETVDETLDNTRDSLDKERRKMEEKIEAIDKKIEKSDKGDINQDY